MTDMNQYFEDTQLCVVLNIYTSRKEEKNNLETGTISIVVRLKKRRNEDKVSSLRTGPRKCFRNCSYDAFRLLGLEIADMLQYLPKKLRLCSRDLMSPWPIF